MEQQQEKRLLFPKFIQKTAFLPHPGRYGFWPLMLLFAVNAMDYTKIVVHISGWLCSDSSFSEVGNCRTPVYTQHCPSGKTTHCRQVKRTAYTLFTSDLWEC